MPHETPARRLVEDLRVEFFRRGISQTRVSEISGLSPSAVSRRLNGEVSPTFDEMEALANAGGFSLHLELVPVVSLERTA